MRKTLIILIAIMLISGLAVGQSDSSEKESLTFLQSIQNTISSLTNQAASITLDKSQYEDLDVEINEEQIQGTQPEISQNRLLIFSIIQSEVNPGDSLQWENSMRLNPTGETCTSASNIISGATQFDMWFYLQGEGISNTPSTAYAQAGTTATLYCDGTYSDIDIDFDAPNNVGEYEYELYAAPENNFIDGFADWNRAFNTGSEDEVLVVSEEDLIPEIDISPSNPSPNQRVTFDAGRSQGDIQSYNWGGDVWGTGQTTTQSFSEGSHTVQLEVDDGLRTETTTKSFNVEPPEISANIDAPDGTTATPGESLTFEAINSDGEDLNYNWGGDVWGNSETITETFNSEGRKQIELEVIDSYQQTDTDSITVNIEYEDPTAKFTFNPQNPEQGEHVNLDASSSQGGTNSIRDYEWNIEGETITGQRPSWKPEQSGQKTIELTVTDSDGETDTETQNINIEETSELSGVTLEAPNYAILNQPTEMRFLKEQATIEAGLDKVEWEIQNKPDQTGEQIEVNFDREGGHEVKMTVIDNEGQEISSETEIIVQEQEPTLIQRIIGGITDLLGL